MPGSAFLSYVRFCLAHVSIMHWVVIVVLSLALIVIINARMRCAAYSAACLGIAVFVGMFSLDVAVVARIIRLGGVVNHEIGVSLVSEYHRLTHGGEARQMEMLANFAAFIPFGFFLSEFLASAKRFSAGRRLRLATLAGFGLSLCIECLQLLLRVGFFELTDLVMNTLGAFVGALISAGLRKVVGERRQAV